MSLKSQMLKSTLISVFAFMLVVLIVLIPRDLNMRIEGYIVVADPAFKWSQFTENVYQFLATRLPVAASDRPDTKDNLRRRPLSKPWG